MPYDALSHAPPLDWASKRGCMAGTGRGGALRIRIDWILKLKGTTIHASLQVVIVLSSCGSEQKEARFGRVPQLRRTYKDATWLFPSSAGSVLVDLVPEITLSVLSFFRPKRARERESLTTPRGDARGRMHKVGFSGSIRSSLGEALDPLDRSANCSLNFTLAVNFRELGCAHQVPGPDYIMKPGNFFHCWDASWWVGTGPPFEISYTKYWHFMPGGVIRCEEPPYVFPGGKQIAAAGKRDCSCAHKELFALQLVASTSVRCSRTVRPWGHV